MTEYGYYYECGSVQDTDEDVWALIERAVLRAVEDDRLHALMVGPMVAASVIDYVDADGVRELEASGRLTVDTLVERISDRHGEAVHEGRAHTDDAGKRAFRRVVQAHTSAEKGAPELVQWALEHVELDPDTYCDGRRPLPLEWVEGEWIFGDREAADTEPAAVISYATEPSPETGDVGWCWWALGKMGDAKTLREAMAKAHAVICEKGGL